MTATAATQFAAMNTAYTTANAGKSIVAVQGYMSVWDWAQEAASMWGTHHDPSIQNTFTTVIKPLLQKADATEQDFTQVDNFFKDNVGGGRNPNVACVPSDTLVFNDGAASLFPNRKSIARPR